MSATGTRCVMRVPKSFFLSLGVALLLTGCGQSKPADATSASQHISNPASPVEIPVTNDGNTQVVQITADDNMHFNGTRFEVAAGRPVRIELKNIGITARAVMAHNVVVLKPNSDLEGFALAAGQAKDQGYLPQPLMGEVLAFTAFAGPGESVQATFTPSGPGEYPFLCSFPGHFSAGMHGIMVVLPPKS